jgi:MFS family permease
LGGTAARLLSAPPFAGRLADEYGAFRLELALFALAAAAASLLYLPTHNFWLLAFVNLTQAAMLAPLVPLADALTLSWSRSTTRGNSGAFEYGWVRGMGSTAFTPPRGGCLQFSGSLPSAFSRRRYRHDLCPTWHPAQIQQLKKGS